MTPAPRRPRRAEAAGFTLIAVLLAVGLMAGLVTAYSRHVIVSGRGGMSSPKMQASRESCHSGLILARQATLTGQEEIPSTIPAGDGLAGVSVTSTVSGHDLLTVESLGEDGLGARRKAELSNQPAAESDPTEPAGLPTLQPDTVAALLSNPSLPLLHVTASKSLSATEITGLVVVHPGVQLQLADVVLKGAIVSASVLGQSEYGAFKPAQAPKVLVTGNLRIDPSPALPGLALLMPDGVVSSAPVDARIQIHGDVVAHDVSLLHPGALEGHVLGVHVTLADPSLLDRLGFDRKPPPWSPALDLGPASEPVFLAIVPPSTALGSLVAIIDYWKKD